MEKDVSYFQHPNFPEFKIRIQERELREGKPELIISIVKANGEVISEVLIPRKKYPVEL